MYDASVAIHVVAAIVGFGVTFAYPVIQKVAERRGLAAAATGLDTVLTLSRYVAVPAALVVGGTGVFQLVDGPYGLRDAWLTIGASLYLGVMVVAAGYLAPAYARARAAALRGSSAEYAAALQGTTIIGPIVAASIVAIAVLMEVKPG